MPVKLVGPCRWPGCPELQEPGGRGYCRKHQLEVWRRDAAERGPARRRYTRTYERAREWALKHEPLCRLCKLEGKLVPATVTHHLTPLSKGGSNRADNLVPLCEDCHGRLHGKHGEELKAKLEREKPSKTERWSFF